jgi:sugar lactone lactonase YvrE
MNTMLGPKQVLMNKVPSHKALRLITSQTGGRNRNPQKEGNLIQQTLHETTNKASTELFRT